MWKCGESWVSGAVVYLCVLKEHKHDFSAISSLSASPYLSMPLSRLIIDLNCPRLWADMDESVA